MSLRAMTSVRLRRLQEFSDTYLRHLREPCSTESDEGAGLQ
jgi:hypothetical protein